VRLADDPASFAGAVVRLLRDADARVRLETAARALVVEQYDWSAVAGALEGALVNIVDGGLRVAASPTTLQSEICNLKSQGDLL